MLKSKTHPSCIKFYQGVSWVNDEWQVYWYITKTHYFSYIAEKAIFYQLKLLFEFDWDAIWSTPSVKHKECT